MSKQAFEKLKLAQELLSHSVPTQDLATFLEHICDKVIKQKARSGKTKKTDNTTIKRTESDATVAADLPLLLSVKKKVLSTQVYCQYKSPITGKICGSKWFAQVDHKQPRWARGRHEASNLQRLCAQHNQLKYRKETGVIYRS